MVWCLHNLQVLSDKFFYSSKRTNGIPKYKNFAKLTLKIISVPNFLKRNETKKTLNSQ